MCSRFSLAGIVLVHHSSCESLKPDHLFLSTIREWKGLACISSLSILKLLSSLIVLVPWNYVTSLSPQTDHFLAEHTNLALDSNTLVDLICSGYFEELFSVNHFSVVYTSQHTSSTFYIIKSCRTAICILPYLLEHFLHRAPLLRCGLPWKQLHLFRSLVFQYTPAEVLLQED